MSIEMGEMDAAVNAQTLGDVAGALSAGAKAQSRSPTTGISGGA